MFKFKSRSHSTTNFQLPLVTKSHSDFIAELQSISRYNRYSSSTYPTLAGKTVDLRKLYNEVALRGGHKQVTFTHSWSEIYLSLGLPSGCIESGHGIRTIYQRYLERFERHQRLASKALYADDTESSVFLDNDSQDADGFRTHRPLGSVENEPKDIPNHLRETWNLSSILTDRVEYACLERALQSGLPNEIDFALNSMLLMSSQSDEFSLHKNVRLLGLLLHSVGISDVEFPSYGVHPAFARFIHFWDANVLTEHGRIFLCPSVLSKHELPPNPNRTRAHGTINCQGVHFGADEEFRVQLVATILRNLAVSGGMNAVTIGRDPQSLRFIFLCVYSNHCYLRQLGLEILSSLHFPATGALYFSVRHLIHELLCSYDRSDRIRGLQLLRHLCEVPVYFTSCSPGDKTTNTLSLLSTDRNADLLLSLNHDILHAVITNLYVKDVYLVMLTLDSLYSLSALGSVFCDRLLMHMHHNSSTYFQCDPSPIMPNGFLKAILNLLQFDATTLGLEGLIRVTCTPSPEFVSTLKTEDCSPPKCPYRTINSVELTSTTSTFSLCSKLSSSSVNSIDKSSVRDLSLLPTRITPSHSSRLSQEWLRYPSQTDTLCSQPPVTPIVTTCSQNMLHFSPTSIASVCRSTAIHTEPPKTTELTSPIISIASCLKTEAALSVPISSHLYTSIFRLHTSQAASSLNEPFSEQAFTATVDNSDQSNCTNSSDSKPIKLTKPIPTKPVRLAMHPLINRDSGCREFASQWLKQHCATRNYSSVPCLQLYTAYQVAHLARFGSGYPSALSLTELHEELKAVFPDVDQVKVQTSSGGSEVHYNNLSCVNTVESNNHQDIVLAMTEPESTDAIHKKHASKRTVETLFNPMTSSPGDRVAIQPDLSEVPRSVKLARKLAGTANGHDVICQIHNVQASTNGLNKEITYVINSPVTLNRNLSSLTNGDSSKTCSDGTRIGLTRYTNLNELVSGEKNLVLLPVFTAVNLRPGANHVANNISSLVHTGGLKHPGLKVRLTTITRAPTSPICSAPDLNYLSANVSLFSTTLERTGSLNSISTSAPTTTMLPTTVSSLSMIECRWADCRRNFSTSSDLFCHVERSHLSSQSETTCHWTGCQSSISSSQALREHIRNDHLVSLLASAAPTHSNCSTPSSEPRSLFDLLQANYLVVNGLEPSRNLKLESLLKSNVDLHPAPNTLVTTTSSFSSTPLFGLGSHGLADPPESRKTNDSSYLFPIANRSSQPEGLVLDNTSCCMWSPTFRVSDDCRRVLNSGLMNPPFLPQTAPEEPITKHIRVTAALVLKNVLRHSQAARNFVCAWENFLCELAFSASDSSPVIFDCLSLLHRDTSPQCPIFLDPVLHKPIL